MTIEVVVTGARGRMGQSLLRALADQRTLRLAGATVRPGSGAAGTDANELVGLPACGVRTCETLEQALSGLERPVVIDFTTPQASLLHGQLCAARGLPLVVGTTGMSPGQKTELLQATRSIPLLLAANFSVGVNVLLSLVAQASRAVGPGWDREIVELHHKHKRDAPSGTALRLAEALTPPGEAPPPQVVARHGEVGPRPDGAVGLQSVRGGDVVGEHTVYFLTEGERLELAHKATSRDVFARGALRAARWLRDQAPGLYDLQDALGLAKQAGPGGEPGSTP